MRRRLRQEAQQQEGAQQQQSSSLAAHVAQHAHIVHAGTGDGALVAQHGERSNNGAAPGGLALGAPAASALNARPRTPAEELILATDEVARLRTAAAAAEMESAELRAARAGISSAARHVRSQVDTCRSTPSHPARSGCYTHLRLGIQPFQHELHQRAIQHERLAGAPPQAGE